MNKQEALEIASCLYQTSLSGQTNYEITKLSLEGSRLQGFHQWVNGKEVLAAFSVTRIGEDTYYLLFIDWHRNNKFYLVVYAGDRSTTYAEIHETVVENQETNLRWKYNPLKRDGKNLERKAYFKQRFGTMEVLLPVPTIKGDVDSFLSKLFSLVIHRLQADQSPDIFAEKMN